MLGDLMIARDEYVEWASSGAAAAECDLQAASWHENDLYDFAASLESE